MLVCMGGGRDIVLNFHFSHRWVRHSVIETTGCGTKHICLKMKGITLSFGALTDYWSFLGLSTDIHIIIRKGCHCVGSMRQDSKTYLNIGNNLFWRPPFFSYSLWTPWPHSKNIPKTTLHIIPQTFITNFTLLLHMAPQKWSHVNDCLDLILPGQHSHWKEIFKIPDSCARRPLAPCIHSPFSASSFLFFVLQTFLLLDYIIPLRFCLCSLLWLGSSNREEKPEQIYFSWRERAWLSHTNALPGGATTFIQGKGNALFFSYFSLTHAVHLWWHTRQGWGGVGGDGWLKLK